MSLQHSNIVQVLDLGVAAGRYFLALELVDGWDLEKILQRAYAAQMVFPAALGALRRLAGLPRARLRARQEPRRQAAGDRPPRHQPQQRAHQRPGRGEADRLRHRQGPAQARADRRRRHQGEGRVHVARAGAGAAAIDRRSDIFSVGSMLYRMMTDKLPFEANNDLESLLRVQKAEFTPPEEAKPSDRRRRWRRIISARCGSRPAERYQTAEEMLVDVERVLRTEFHSAGQTELKPWLEQLGRRDNAPSIGKAPRDTGGVVNDMRGDRSVGRAPRSSSRSRSRPTGPSCSGARRRRPDADAHRDEANAQGAGRAAGTPRRSPKPGAPPPARGARAASGSASSSRWAPWWGSRYLLRLGASTAG